MFPCAGSGRIVFGTLRCIPASQSRRKMTDLPERLRILIVDDDPLDRAALARALKRDALKYDTIAADLVEAQTLSAAREALAREEFSCIFLDYGLPDGSGLELLIEIRDRDLHTPVIVLTGQRDEGAMMALMQAGAVDYVPKSILSPELVARSVRSAVRFQQVQREKQEALKSLSVRDNAIAAASNGIIISDATQRGYPIIYANPAFLALSGYALEDVLGRSCRFLQGPGTDPAAVQKLRDALRDQRRTQTLILNYRKDGTEFWNEVTISPVRDDAGAVTQFVGVQTDVTFRQGLETERMAVATKLQETVALLDTLLSSAPVGFAFFDADLRYQRVNETLAQMSGMTADNLRGRTILEALPGLAAVTEQSLRPVLETGQAQVNVEVRGTDPSAPDKERFWLSSYYPVDGAFANRLGVGVIVVEITQRKEAEEATRLFQFLSDKASDAFYLIDADSRFVYANEAAQLSLGYTSEQMQKLTVKDINESLREGEYAELFRQAQNGPVPPFESENRRADGKTFPVELSVTSLTMRGKTLLFTSSRDITERRRQQEELAALYDREHRIAEALQRSLLNKPPASVLAALDIETLYRPAWDEALVGGDYFDVFALDGGRLALAVGDVSGKGLEAASRTAEIKYTLRAYLREHTDPASALSRLNAFLCEAQTMDDSADEYFVVMTLAVLEVATGMVHLAVAGSEPPLVLRSEGSFQEVAVSGVPLGIAAKANYSGVDFYLEPDALLLVATDGITEARRGRQFLGNDGMARLALEALPLGSLKDIAQAVLDGATAFAENRLHDDVCLLLARRK